MRSCEACLEAAVFSALRDAEGPLSVRELQARATGWTGGAVTVSLSRMVRDGIILRIPGRNGGKNYRLVPIAHHPRPVDKRRGAGIVGPALPPLDVRPW